MLKKAAVVVLAMEACCAGDWPTSTKLMLGKGSVSVATGDFHVQLRKLLKPAFSMSGIANMVPKVAVIAEQCLSKWADEEQIKGMLATKEFTFRVSPTQPPSSGVMNRPS